MRAQPKANFRQSRVHSHTPIHADIIENEETTNYRVLKTYGNFNVRTHMEPHTQIKSL